MNNAITKCIINKSIIDPTVNVVKVWINDEPDWQIIFTYYPNEIHFDQEEIIGLTVEDAQNLHIQRELEYLRS